MIWVSSGGMYTTQLDVDAMRNVEGEYDGVQAYAMTQRAQVVLAEQWADRFAREDPRTIVHAMHPGWAATPGVQTSLPRFWKTMEGRLRAPERGADTAAWLAISDRAAWAGSEIRGLAPVVLQRRPMSIGGPEHEPDTTEDDVVLSREQRRDEATAYRELAQRLARGNERLPAPPFDDALVRDVEQARTFLKGARNRQIRRLAQQLAVRGSVEEIVNALEGRTPELAAERAEERKNEAWRARLLAEGDDALTELVAQYPQADTGRLRQQIRQASAEPGSKRSKKAALALLREIRALRE